MGSRFPVRSAEEDDPASIAALFAEVRAYYPARFVHGLDLAAEEVARLMQTGHAFLLAEREGRLAAAVRHREEDGIAWFDLLASGEAGAGRALVAAVERLAQDRGLRLVRTRIPDLEILEAYLGRRGYVGISRESGDDGEPALVVEKRLPLLTVREQRRADAEAIAALTGEDPWVFEQMARPGWFVASDGERVVGAIGVRDGGDGVARLTVPALLEGYSGRGLEPWMVDRAAYYAETNGYHTGELPLTPETRLLERVLEDRRWFPEGEVYVRRFVGRGEVKRAEE
ncbi:MAG: hypothetical protein ACRDHF_08265 [Tepidiformaceae bacterium]